MMSKAGILAFILLFLYRFRSRSGPVGAQMATLLPSLSHCSTIALVVSVLPHPASPASVSSP